MHPFSIRRILMADLARMRKERQAVAYHWPEEACGIEVTVAPRILVLQM